MDADSRKRADVAVKNEDDHGDVDITTKPSYRSWKKKYRKMRIVFDEKMQENERLHQMEQKALATAKRLAIYNDRLLDVLLDVNDSPQIPPEKRISLDPPSDDADEFEFKFVRQPTPPPREGPPPLKSYKSLLSTVPHITFADNPDKFPTLQEDLRIGRDSPADPLQGASYPPSFLTPDDIDNYLYELDKKLNFPDDIPTMAPLARPEENVPRDTSRDFALRNPVSVYNWLRKHAPKTFLQDGEHQDKDDDAATATPVPAAGRGAGGRATKGERSSTRGGAGTGRGGKRAGGGGGGGGARASLAAAAAAAGDDDEDTAYEGAATPTTAASKGKRKRITDDDPGYRPKGGSSRPTKKKRKSEGGVEGTPTASAKRGPRKSGGDLVMKDD